MTPDRDQNEDVRRARLIADRVEDIDGIRAATVIVSGTTAYVGVDLSANAEGKLTNELKNTVVKTAKKTDKTLSRVYVSADVDTVARLRNYARDIERGRPMSGFVNEINEMFRRPAPTVR
jgi:YhcN/YlaJ family sporulation lipoprotein